MNESPHGLYRCFDEGGVLLYIGASINPLSRLGSHSYKVGWFTDIALVKIEKHATRDAAFRAETAAVIAENPKYNIVPKKRENGIAHKTPYPQNLGAESVYVGGNIPIEIKAILDKAKLKTRRSTGNIFACLLLNEYCQRGIDLK